MKQKFQQFMIGRYGIDELNYFIFGLFIAINILSLLFKSNIFLIIAIILLIYMYFRMFSKNIYKRVNENNKFMFYYRPIQSKIRAKINEFKNRKTYKYYSCPNCKQRLRVPRNKGEISITCSRCKVKFDKKT